jgi:DNA-binding Xre family transcriptional regulator
MGIRQCLLDLIDRSGVSDRRLSLLATGKGDTIRNMRRGATPVIESLEVLCRVLGFRLQMMSLDEPADPAEEAPAVEKRPEWPRRLREEIRQDLVEILGQADKRRS